MGKKRRKTKNVFQYFLRLICSFLIVAMFGEEVLTVITEADVGNVTQNNTVSQSNADYLADVTFYDYYGKYQTSDTSDNGHNDHYSFERFNQVISDYAKANGMLYPMYFGDFNGAAGDNSNGTVGNPTQGQPLMINGVPTASNFYWAVNRANRKDNNYSASLQGLVSNKLDNDGDITQDKMFKLDYDNFNGKEYIYDFNKVTVDGKDQSKSIVTKEEREDVLKATMSGSYENQSKAFRIYLPISVDQNQDFKGHRYLKFDVYNETKKLNGEYAGGDPFIAVKDTAGNQIAGWSNGYTVDYYNNSMKEGQWNTVVVDLEKLKTNSKPENGVSNPQNFNYNIKEIWIGHWGSGDIYIDNITFANEIPTLVDEVVKLPYFDSSIIQGNMGETVSGLKFPFKMRDRNGIKYYSFSSGKSGYQVNNSQITDVVRINRENNHLDYWFDVPDNDPNTVLDMNGTQGWGGGKNEPGYFPFNQSGDDNNISKLNYGFGTKIEVPFLLSKTGTIKDLDGNEIPMEFNFKGDDDVWVYIDDQLVLDMGGAHSQTTGRINFKDKIATVDKVVDGGVASHDLYRKVIKSEKSFDLPIDSYVNNNKEEGYDEDRVHVLTLFYMERGMIESNLYLDFSFIPVQDKVIVEKEVDISGVNPSLEGITKDIANNEDFTFNIYENDIKQSGLDYIFNDKDTIAIKAMDKEKFKLKNSELAIFEGQFERGNTVKVEEIPDSRFSTSYITKDLTAKKESILSGNNGLPVFGNVTNSFTISTKHEPYVFMKHYAKFINKINTGVIRISKEVQSAIEKDKVFNFRVTINKILGRDIEPIDYSGEYEVVNEDGSRESKNTIEVNGVNVIQIKAGQTIEIKGIPLESTFEIEEIQDTPRYRVAAIFMNGVDCTPDGSLMPDKNKISGKLDESNVVDQIIVNEITYVNECIVRDILIQKVDANDQTIALKGAKFKIYSNENDAKQGINAIKHPNNPEIDWEVECDDNGQATFKDLPYGDYWIVETVAPEGYELLRAPIKVTIKAESAEIINIKVANRKIIKLPFTGGNGTNNFNFTGILLIFVALIMCIIQANKKNIKFIKKMGMGEGNMRISKKFRSVLGVALSAMLTLGTINVQANPLPVEGKEGSITIHKYKMSSIPNPGTPATGLEDGAQVPSGAELLEGVEFKIQEVIEDENGTLTFDNIKYSLVAGTEQTETTGAKDTDDHGIARFTNLKQGIYLVTELDNAGVLQKGEPFLVSIPMAHPTEANSWLYDVHVYPKNVVAGEPGIDKDVTSEGNKDDTANIGENVTWIIKPSIPADIADAKKYDIIDSLDSRLNYTGNFRVYYINGDEEVDIDKKYYSSNEPMLEINPNPVDPSNGGGIIKVSFEKEEGFKYLDSLYKAGVNSIRISFTTVINTSVELGKPIPNDVTLDYTNSFGTNTEYNPDKVPEVHTGAVLLEKVDASNNGTKLKGAKFKIYPTEKDAKAGTNAIMNPENKDLEWEVESDKNGRAVFYGLSYGSKGDDAMTGSTNYWIVETVAPTYTVEDNDGKLIEKQYNLLKKPLEVTVNATSHLGINKVIVKNSKFTLPLTGGAGTFMLTLGGLLMMSGAVYLYMVTRKKPTK